MKTVTLPVAYIPLVDAAPLIVAQEMGFAEAEGLNLDLIQAPSWSSVRDMLSFGRVDAAHMLSPIPVAMALGLGGVSTALSAVSVMSVNGDVIGVNRHLADHLKAAGYQFDFKDPVAAGRALSYVHPTPIRFGVPFPFSMHVELLHYWMDAAGVAAPGAEIKVIPPPLMAEALAAGEIDAFCVGEPWGSIAVENGSGELLLPGAAIWKFSPEKVLAVRSEWAETEPHLLGRLSRATWQAGRWLASPSNMALASEILARKTYLDVPALIIERSLTGRLIISPRGDARQVDRFIEFHHGVANFPWRSQAAWIANQIAGRVGLDRHTAIEAARSVFRSDLYRRDIAPLGAEMPGASEKVEGSIREATAVASDAGKLFLLEDGFFDGRIFDPTAED